MFSENEREFSYLHNSPSGPTHWGEIHGDWAKCNNGNRQSPIDISSKNVRIDSQLGKFKRSYKAAAAVVINRGHDIMVSKQKAST